MRESKLWPAVGRIDNVYDAWIVNPTTRTLEAYRREGSGWLLLATHADAAVARIEPFDAIELRARGAT